MEKKQLTKLQMRIALAQDPELMEEAKNIASNPHILDSLKDKIGKLAHGGLIGSAHPSALDELAQVEKDKIGKLAHGGLIGSAHPSALDELTQVEAVGTPSLSKIELHKIVAASPELLDDLQNIVKNPEILEGLKDKIGKLAHGGLIGSAHPSALDELTQVEKIKK